MRLLHTSDWHLGMSFRSGITYVDDQKHFINEICHIATQNKVDGILIAGDVFDKSIASQDALALYDEAMTHICTELNIPVYIVAGNHDGAERLSSCNKLLEKSGLHIAGVLSSEPFCVCEGDVDIYLLPWISTDRVRAAYPDKAEEISSLQDAYKVVLDHYREVMNTNHKNIIVAHAYIADAETSTSDRAAEIGRATMVDSNVFESFDYVALGHLHGAQQITDHIRYSGTPMAYSFGKEETQTKSVTIYDTDTAEIITIPINNLHNRATLHGTYDELLEGEIDESVRCGYVKLEISDRYIGMDVMASMRERYPRLLEISGKSFEREDAKITMSIDEFESADTSPEVVFDRYCRDMLEEAPGEHILGLFNKALAAYEAEGSEE